MSHYARTPRMNPRMVPPAPVVYTTISNPAPSPYYNQGATLGRHQSLGSYLPSQPIYHVATSDPSHSRSHHRSSSKSRNHRRSHSTDRHGSSSRRNRHHHRSSSRPRSSRYSPEAQYATIPSSRHRRHSYSVPEHHYRSSSRGPHGAIHHSHREHHSVTRHRESIGERIKRFFGIGNHRVRFVDRSGHQVDRLGRPIYPM